MLMEIVEAIDPYRHIAFRMRIESQAPLHSSPTKKTDEKDIRLTFHTRDMLNMKWEASVGAKKLHTIYFGMLSDTGTNDFEINAALPWGKITRG